MPGLLDAVASHPPRAFVIQTRGSLILRDIDRLRTVAARTRLRIGFSITTDREDVRRVFEPHCSPIEERWSTVAALRAAGIPTAMTIAPILPCDPETLAKPSAIEAAETLLSIADPPAHTRGQTRRSHDPRRCERWPSLQLDTGGRSVKLDSRHSSARLSTVLKAAVNAPGRNLGMGSGRFWTAGRGSSRTVVPLGPPHPKTGGNIVPRSGVL